MVEYQRRLGAEWFWLLGLGFRGWGFCGAGRGWLEGESLVEASERERVAGGHAGDDVRPENLDSVDGDELEGGSMKLEHVRKHMYVSCSLVAYHCASLTNRRTR